jgi:glycerol-3-phosphate dehydrogenase (NAD(P)+)
MSEPSFTSTAILGSGSFGMALAKLLAPKLESIVLLSRDPKTAEAINNNRRNPHYLSSVEMDSNVSASTSLQAALDHPLILFAVPTSATREMASQLAARHLPEDVTLLSCAKGIEKSTGDRMSQVLREIFPHNPIAVISGPNHAEEIATGMATCAVIGSENHELAVRLQDLFTLPHFRSYTSDDLAGIELGGAVKNVYAIAAGMAHGLGLGDNAVAALVTRALAEMTRLGIALGGRSETFSGLSGVGDLIVTCFSPHSRNHRVGLALGAGKSLEEAVSALGMVAEGVPNTLSIHEAATRAGVRTPIIDSVFSILYQGKPVPQAMKELLSRDPRPEHS